MYKVGNDDFIFPVGKGGIYGQAGVSGITDITTKVSGEYFNAVYTDIASRSPTMGQVSDKEYWAIERSVTSDSMKVQLFWTNASSSSIVDCDFITIAHYTGGWWTNEQGTAVGGSICTGSGSGSVQTNGFVTSFSPFTFGGNGGEALPIKLVSFNATAGTNAVNTNWQTQQEINNAFFTVERSANAKDFTAVGTVKGAGNSEALLNYEFTDAAPLKGESYYRLRQTDFNGNTTLSNIVPVKFGIGGSTLAVYPNPAHGRVSVNVTNPSGQITLKVYDVTGWEVYSKIVNVENNESDQTLSIPSGVLNPGMYVVSAYNGNEESDAKLVIQ
jgi:hypothetical protein